MQETLVTLKRYVEKTRAKKLAQERTSRSKGKKLRQSTQEALLTLFTEAKEAGEESCSYEFRGNFDGPEGEVKSIISECKKLAREVNCGCVYHGGDDLHEVVFNLLKPYSGVRAHFRRSSEEMHCTHEVWSETLSETFGDEPVAH